MSEERRQRWERRAEWPLTVFAVLFLAAYAWPILEPNLNPGWRGVATSISRLVWAGFLMDYLVRLGLASDRRRFLRSSWLDLAAVALPLLRPLRLLRLVRVLSVLNRRAGSSLRGRVLTYVAGSAVLVLVVASLAELDAERGQAGANISTYADALWWAVTTVTTVGYGDHFPVTVEGRLVAGGLMLTGIALIGVVTAAFASWLVESVARAEEESQAVTRRDIEALIEQVQALRAELRDTRSAE